MHGAAEKRGAGERIVRNQDIVTAATKIVKLRDCSSLFVHLIILSVC